MLLICALFSFDIWGGTAGGLVHASSSLSSMKSDLRGRNILNSISSNLEEVIPIDTRVSLQSIKIGLLSKLSFQWVNSLMKIGNRKSLDMLDIWELDKKSQMSNVSEMYHKYYRNEIMSSTFEEQYGGEGTDNIFQIFLNSQVMRAIFKMYKKPLIVSGLYKLVNTFVQFLPALIVARILKQVESTSLNALSVQKLSSKSIFLVATLFLTLCSKTIVENQYFDIVSNGAASVRAALSAEVFRKSLKLSPESRQNATTGEILNYMQMDTTRIENVAVSIHIIWDGLLQIVGYSALLLRFLGPSVLAGIAALAVIVPVNAMFLQRLSALRADMLRYTDNRVKLTEEILQGVRAIKSYNWETPFIEQLRKLRALELDALRASTNTRAMLIAVLSAAPSFVAVLTLYVYVLLGNVLSPVKVFTALGLFNQLRFPLIFYPMVINNLAEGKISLQRLSKFLKAKEVVDYVNRDPAVNGLSEDVAVGITAANFSWTAPVSGAEGSGGRGRLSGVDLNIRKGELVAVIGPVGSGKSTLLASLLGELHKEAGNVTVIGSVAYVPQTSWIPNESLRNVILFGKPLEESVYSEVVRVCGLERDLELLEAGDQTEIGERGVNLSGGQKQRVSIARAVYDNADVYLFDDPLSALDSEVGAKVFSDCVKGFLHRKTRILVTHQLTVLPQVDRIILMINDEFGSCRILDQGTFFELLERGHDVSDMAMRYEKEKEVSSEEVVEDDATASSLANFGVPEVASADPDVEGNDSMVESGSAGLDVPTIDKPSDNIVKSGSTGPSKASSGASSGPEHLPASSTSVPAAAEETLKCLPPTGGVVDVCNGVDCVVPDDGQEDRPAACVSPDEVVVSDGSKKFSNQDEDSLQPLLEGIGTGDAVLSGGSEGLESHVEVEEDVVVPDEADKLPVKLMTKEDRGEGAVGWDVYRSYLTATGSPVLVSLVFASIITSSFSQVLQQGVVAAWTSDPTYSRHSLPLYLFGVGAAAVGVAFFTYMRTFLSCLVGMRASETLHGLLVSRILRAPLSYFESTPVGRLMQRFSKDFDSVDQQLPSSLSQVVASAMQIFAAMAAICVVTPSFTFVVLPLMAVYLFVTQYYLNVARELKRLDSLSRSPIFSHFGEALGGLSVIRCFKKESLFRAGNEKRLNDNLSVYYALKAVDRWLSLRLELLANVIVGCSATLVLWSGSKAGAAGVSLNNALGVTGLLNWAVRNAVDAEALMTSVERVVYTTKNTPQEKHHFESELLAAAGAANTTSTTTSPPLSPSSGKQTSDDELSRTGWPWRGGIVLKDLRMRYRGDFEPVLRGVSASINAGESIGIVGRTGSGKSSLFRALLRLTELEKGSILVDGVDISRLGLAMLRSTVSIIPQDPMLFSGSIRYNLDPRGSHDDAKLWMALNKAHLGATVRGLPGGLSYVVSESGDNFSSGQKQLLCLARALVRHSRLLLLDEATSSVDSETDELIQQTIRQEFGGGKATVLTIAHRLRTVLDADKILVMDAGRVAEFASPGELLRNPNSIFFRLVANDKLTSATASLGGSAAMETGGNRSVPVEPSTHSKSTFSSGKIAI